MYVFPRENTLFEVSWLRAGLRVSAVFPRENASFPQGKYTFRGFVAPSRFEGFSGFPLVGGAGGETCGTEVKRMILAKVVFLCRRQRTLQNADSEAQLEVWLNPYPPSTSGS